MSYDRFYVIKIWQALVCKLEEKRCKGLIVVEWGERGGIGEEAKRNCLYSTGTDCIHFY